MFLFLGVLSLTCRFPLEPSSISFHVLWVLYFTKSAEAFSSSDTLPQGKVFQENVTCYTVIADKKSSHTESIISFY